MYIKVLTDVFSIESDLRARFVKRPDYIPGRFFEQGLGRYDNLCPGAFADIGAFQRLYRSFFSITVRPWDLW